MHQPTDVWSFGPNNPILSLVSFEYVQVHTGTYVISCIPASHPHGRDGKSFYLSANSAIIGAAANIIKL